MRPVRIVNVGFDVPSHLLVNCSIVTSSHAAAKDGCGHDVVRVAFLLWLVMG